MIRLLALIFCFPVAAFAQWVPYANNPITTTSVDTPSAATLYLGNSNANAVSIGNASALATFLGGITSTAAANSLGATSFSGAITGGQAAALGAITATSWAVGSGTTTNAGLQTVNGSAGVGTGYGGIYAQNVTPSTTNYALGVSFNNATVALNAGSTVQLQIGGSGIASATSTGLAVTGVVSATSKIYPDTGDTPTIASGACGTTTNGTIAGNDQTGVITIGAAATTTCTVSFGATWSTAPKACLFSPNNAAAAAVTVLPYSTITNASTWVLHGAVLASTTWNYHCF